MKRQKIRGLVKRVILLLILNYCGKCFPSLIWATDTMAYHKGKQLVWLFYIFSPQKWKHCWPAITTLPCITTLKSGSQITLNLNLNSPSYQHLQMLLEHVSCLVVVLFHLKQFIKNVSNLPRPKPVFLNSRYFYKNFITVSIKILIGEIWQT